RDGRRNVLHQGAASRDVQHLRSAAYRENGEVCLHGAARKVDLEFVAPRLRILDTRVAILAVKRRVDVAAAGQEHAVDGLQYRPRAFADLEHTRSGTGAFHRGEIVIEPAAPCHANHRDLVHDYILAGTPHPSKSNARAS